MPVIMKTTYMIFTCLIGIPQNNWTTVYGMYVYVSSIGSCTIQTIDSTLATPA